MSKLSVEGQSSLNIQWQQGPSAHWNVSFSQEAGSQAWKHPRYRSSRPLRCLPSLACPSSLPSSLSSFLPSFLSFVQNLKYSNIQGIYWWCPAKMCLNLSHRQSEADLSDCNWSMGTGGGFSPSTWHAAFLQALLGSGRSLLMAQCPYCCRVRTAGAIDWF